jgi:hypothetical protein
MVAELEPYLLSNELYWPIGGPALPGGGNYPRLTFGGLFLAVARLRAVEAGLPVAQSAELTQSKTRLEAARLKWRAAVDRKLDREIKSRLDLWTVYLRECSENRAACADHYPQQAEYRAMLELLLAEISRLTEGSSHEGHLASADRTLRAFFRKGGFVWAPELKAGFPPDVFWFLYGSVG